MRYRRFDEWYRSLEARRPWRMSVITGVSVTLGTLVGIAIVGTPKPKPLLDSLTLWWLLFTFIFGCIGGRFAIWYRTRAARRA